MNETLRTINSKSAFIGKSGVRVVNNPNGTRSLAARVNSPIPKNILNMGNIETFPGHLHENFNPHTRRTTMNSTRVHGGRMTHNWQRYQSATRYQIIRFIMWAYYAHLYMPYSNTRRALSFFYRAIAEVLTRANNNKNKKIPVVQLYRLLSRLNKPTLMKLATFVEW